MKVQETDWVDISADLANVDDNTPDNNQGIDEDEAMLEDLQITNDDDDDDDSDMGTKFDDGNNIEFQYYQLAFNLINFCLLYLLRCFSKSFVPACATDYSIFE